MRCAVLALCFCAYLVDLRVARGAFSRRAAVETRPKDMGADTASKPEALRRGYPEAERLRSARLSAVGELIRLYEHLERALARTGRMVSAIYELNSALVCKPKPKEQAEIYDMLAQGYDKLGEAEFAKQARAYKQQIESAPAPADPAKGKRKLGGGDEEGT